MRHCSEEVMQTLTKCVEAALIADRFPANALSWWLSTSKLDKYTVVAIAWSCCMASINYVVNCHPYSFQGYSQEALVRCV